MDRPSPSGPATAAAPTPLLLRQRAAWTYLGVSRTLWFKLKHRPDFPKPVELEGVQYWRRADLDKFSERLRPARPRRRREPKGDDANGGKEVAGE
jgi:hypothetical protein